MNTCKVIQGEDIRGWAAYRRNMLRRRRERWMMAAVMISGVAGLMFVTGCLLLRLAEIGGVK